MTLPPSLERLMPYAAAGLLTIVACRQIYLAKTQNLRPWKGGGFGMFSTVDRRFFRSYLITDAGDALPVETPGSPLAGLSLSAPTSERLARLARELRASTWATADTSGCPAGSAPPGPKLVEDGQARPDPRNVVHVSKVRVELWKLEFDAHTRLVTTRKIIDATE